MKQISFLIKPASSLCNMKCRYCFYGDVSRNRKEKSMGIMKQDVMQALIQKSLNMDMEEVHYCFQGGEPCMAGIHYFRDFISTVHEYNNGKKITYSIQTNGTLLDHEWIKLFAENDFLVGVSLDGFIRNHDYFRRDGSDKGTFKRILYNIRQLRNAGVFYNILTVLTHELSRKPEELFRFYCENGFDYVQLIPCLPSLKKNEPTDRYSLQPRDFSSFYKKFFDLWYEEFRKGQYMSVTLFDNLIPMYRGIIPQQCGMLGNCSMQMVVEADGSVYPCDFYVLDEYRCGNVMQDRFEDMQRNAVAIRFLNEKKNTCHLCSSCRFINMCHGNCRRLNGCYFDEDYCGYQDFLSYSMNRMNQIAKSLR